MSKGAVLVLLAVLGAVHALPVDVAHPGVVAKRSFREQKELRFRELVGNSRTHFQGQVGTVQVQALVDQKADGNMVVTFVAPSPDVSTAVVQTTSANKVMKLEATFSQGKRVFLVPSTNTLILVSSTVATDASLKAPIALIMKTDFRPAPGGTKWDSIMMGVQNYFTAAAGLLADLVDDGTVTDMPTVKKPDDFKAVFAASDAAWPAVLDKAKSPDVAEDIDLLKVALPKAMNNLYKYGNMVTALDINTCQFGTSSVDSLRGDLIANAAFDEIKAKAKPASGSFIELADPPAQPPAFMGLTSDMQGWLKSGAKAGADALLKPFIGAMDEEIKARKPPAEYLDFFVPERVEYGLLGVEEGKVPLHHLNVARTTLDKEIRKQLEADLVTVMFNYEPLAKFIVGADKLQDSVKKDVTDWLKGVAEWLKQLIKIEKKAADKKLEVAGKIKTEGQKMDLGEAEIASQMLQAAAMGRLHHCTQKLIEAAKPIKEARGNIKKKIEAQPKWKASNKFEFKPDIGFGKSPAEIVKGIGLTETFKWTKLGSKHELKFKANLKDPFDEKKNKLDLSVRYEYSKKDLSAGVEVKTTVLGIMKSPDVDKVTATGWVKWKNGNVKQGVILTLQVDPKGKKPSTATFNYNLDIKFTETLSFMSRTTVAIRGGTDPGTTFSPSALAKFDQTIGIKWKIRPNLNLALNGNLGFEENNFMRGRVTLGANGHLANVGNNARLSWTAGVGAGFSNDLSGGGASRSEVMGFVGLRLTW